jgi:hypothetical protein
MHAGKCNGDGNNTGDGIGNDVAGDKVGMARAKGGLSPTLMPLLPSSLPLLFQQPSSLLLPPPQSPNDVALNAAIAAAVAIAHLFDTAIKQ